MQRLQEVVRLHRLRRSRRQIEREPVDVASHHRGGRSSAFIDAGPAGWIRSIRCRRRAIWPAALDATRPRPATPKQQQSSVGALARGTASACGEEVPGATAIRDWLRLNREEFSGSLSAVKRNVRGPFAAPPVLIRGDIAIPAPHRARRGGASRLHGDRQGVRPGAGPPSALLALRDGAEPQPPTSSETGAIPERKPPSLRLLP